MKVTFRMLAPILFSIGMGCLAFSQASLSHNTWTTGAPMPTAVDLPGGVGVLGGRIFVVGGGAASGLIAATQIYNPTTNSWSTGVSLPDPLSGGTAAVVKGILYVIGGFDGTIGNVTNAVWAFNPSTKKWTSKSPMPTARMSAGVAVENSIIYVIGGNSITTLRTNSVESYNPATDTWTEESPLLFGKSEPSVGLVGSLTTGYTIVAADGHTTDAVDHGDNEGYDASTNTWSSFAPDPTGRNGACGGGIGQKMYVAGGYDGNIGADMSLTEAFKVSTNTWKTLAPMPTATLFPGSAVYKGQLYCLGGATAYNGTPMANVQIYQP